VPGNLKDYLKWAAWMREHARDPQFMPHVIRNDASAAEMAWGRWSDWNRGDPRWCVHVIDTSTLPVEQLADELLAWIKEERELLRSEEHPLSEWAE
jgi:hypothetical protein